MTDPLVVKNLWKTYKTKEGPIHALQGVNFSVKKGEIFGLLGPNGAGKTTTINILTGLMDSEKGEVLYFGLPLNEKSLGRLSYSSAYSSLTWWITVEQNLRVFAKMYNVKNSSERINELLTQFDILKERNKKVSELSTGQRTRLNLCKALLHNPDILFLDEATAGLDPDIAYEVRSIIKKLDTTIIFTSHIMSEVEELCDRIAFINHGKIVSVGTAKELKDIVKREQKKSRADMNDVFLHFARKKK